MTVRRGGGGIVEAASGNATVGLKFSGQTRVQHVVRDYGGTLDTAEKV